MGFELPPLTSPDWLLRTAVWATSGGFYSNRGIGGFGGRVGVGLNPSGGTIRIPQIPGYNAPPVTTPPLVDVGSNAPPPQVPTDWGPLPASGGYAPPNIFHTGPINPRGPPRKRNLPTYRTFHDCVNADPTDTGVERCAELYGYPAPDEAPVDITEPWQGESVPMGVLLPELIVGRTIIGTVLGPIIAGGLLWPTAAGKGSDFPNYAVPAPAARPGRRGGRRYRPPPPGTVPRPTAPPRPVARPRSSGPVTISRPRTQASAQVQTGEIQAPRPSSLPQTQVITSSSSTPGEVTIASPTAAPAIPTAAPSILSRIGQWATNLAPFLPLALPYVGVSSSPSFAPRTQAATYPLTDLQPNALTSPATAALPQSDRCSTARTRQKRRKKPCTNPTVSSRVETRGGKRYSITKRWLKCPASSRRKPRSRRVR